MIEEQETTTVEETDATTTEDTAEAPAETAPEEVPADETDRARFDRLVWEAAPKAEKLISRAYGAEIGEVHDQLKEDIERLKIKNFDEAGAVVEGGETPETLVGELIAGSTLAAILNGVDPAEL